MEPRRRQWFLSVLTDDGCRTGGKQQEFRYGGEAEEDEKQAGLELYRVQAAEDQGTSSISPVGMMTQYVVR